jgi:1,4-dihydroxy-2-naphthoate octaprenyltransferase
MPNLTMWGRAVRIIPRLDKAEWDELDLVARWLIASRSAVLVMTLTSAALAGLLAVRDGAFDPWLFGLVTLGLCLAHATNNLVNDLTDSLSGVDRGSYFRTRYGPQPLESGLLTMPQLGAYIAATGLAALAIGGSLVWVRGELVLWLVAAGAFFVLFYTFPLKYIGLGEPAVLLVWGPLMVGGGHAVITGAWSTPAAWVGLVYALGPTAVLFGKHIDKLDEDRSKRIRTLPVLLGERAARACVPALLVAQQAGVVALVATGTLGPAGLAALGALPGLRRVLRIFRRPRPDAPPPGYPEGIWPLYFVGATFWYTRRQGALFALGLLLDVALVRL